VPQCQGKSSFSTLILNPLLTTLCNLRRAGACQAARLGWRELAHTSCSPALRCGWERGVRRGACCCSDFISSAYLQLPGPKNIECKGMAVHLPAALRRGRA
jgi:hypothetical protein